MSVATKRRILLLGPLLVALWPLAHNVLVRRYDVDPWKFFGWAMYCRPANRVSVYVFRESPDGWQPIPSEDLGPAIAEEIGRFQRIRSYYGAFVSPTRLGEDILRARPDLAGVMVVVENLKLDPESGRFAADRRVSRFARH